VDPALERPTLLLILRHPANSRMKHAPPRRPAVTLPRVNVTLRTLVALA
jgi:hypothetical protein